MSEGHERRIAVSNFSGKSLRVLGHECCLVMKVTYLVGQLWPADTLSTPFNRPKHNAPSTTTPNTMPDINRYLTPSSFMISLLTSLLNSHWSHCLLKVTLTNSSFSEYPKMEPLRSKTTFRFLDLPVELRNKVYQYLLSTKYTKIELTYHEQGVWVGLSFIRCCKSLFIMAASDY